MSDFHHRTVRTNGVRLHYAEAGAGPLVILCHGFPESWYSWRHQLRALAANGYRAVALDQRGYGDSDSPRSVESYSLCHLAGDIVGLTYELGERRAILVGHDWGSPVAWTTALLRPDIFYGLALLSVPYIPVSGNGRRPTESLRAMVGESLDFYQLYFQNPEVPESELDRDVRRTLLGLYYSASASAPPEHRWRPIFSRTERFIDTIQIPGQMPAWLTEDDLSYYVERFKRSGFRGPLNWYRNLDRNAELLAFLRGALIRQPAVFIAGEQDPVLHMYRDAYNTLETNMPNLSHKVLVPGAGHWVQQEQPGAVNATLLHFLEQWHSASTV